MQTIATILDSNNPDWTNITNQINSVQEAMKAAAYCTVMQGNRLNENDAAFTTDLIINGKSLSGKDVINVNTGVVNNRPSYDPTVALENSGFTSVLQITVKSGNEAMVLQRTFTVPMYTQAEVISQISNAYTPEMWQIIKGYNTMPGHICADLSFKNAIDTIKLMHKEYLINTAVEDAIPTLTYTSRAYRDWETDRKSTRLNSSHSAKSRMPSSA